jgi:hypothetical protein
METDDHMQRARLAIGRCRRATERATRALERAKGSLASLRADPEQRMVLAGQPRHRATRTGPGCRLTRPGPDPAGSASPMASPVRMARGTLC